MITEVAVDVDTLTNKISTTEFTRKNSGISARYVPIDDKWGFKIYKDLHEAYYTYFAQRIIAHFDYAPLVGQQIKIGEDFGYIVETANIQKLNENEFWRKFPRFEQYKFENEVEDATGISQADLHHNNVGFIGDRLLVIDCGQGWTSHDIDDIEWLQFRLTELGLWRGDEVEYSAWGKIPEGTYTNK